MRVLVACEFSGIVRDAFTKRGHEAWSCDIIPSERPGLHILGDAVEAAYSGHWDLMIAHPPCTYLAISGSHLWNVQPWRKVEQRKALAFVRELMRAPIPRIALENPISIISSRVRKPDQIIHPYHHGHREVKSTCLWLKGLPPLTPTKLVDANGHSYIRAEGSGVSRKKDRSRTPVGIARAMAEQWG
jgi:hypothetical protein